MPPLKQKPEPGRRLLSQVGRVLGVNLTPYEADVAQREEAPTMTVGASSRCVRGGSDLAGLLQGGAAGVDEQARDDVRVDVGVRAAVLDVTLAVLLDLPRDA